MSPVNDVTSDYSLSLASDLEFSAGDLFGSEDLYLSSLESSGRGLSQLDGGDLFEPDRSSGLFTFSSDDPLRFDSGGLFETGDSGPSWASHNRGESLDGLFGEDGRTASVSLGLVPLAVSATTAEGWFAGPGVRELGSRALTTIGRALPSFTELGLAAEEFVLTRLPALSVGTVAGVVGGVLLPSSLGENDWDPNRRADTSVRTDMPSGAVHAQHFERGPDLPPFTETPIDQPRFHIGKEEFPVVLTDPKEFLYTHPSYLGPSFESTTFPTEPPLDWHDTVTGFPGVPLDPRGSIYLSSSYGTDDLQKIRFNLSLPPHAPLIDQQNIVQAPGPSWLALTHPAPILGRVNREGFGPLDRPTLIAYERFPGLWSAFHPITEGNYVTGIVSGTQNLKNGLLIHQVDLQELPGWFHDLPTPTVIQGGIVAYSGRDSPFTPRQYTMLERLAKTDAGAELCGLLQHGEWNSLEDALFDVGATTYRALTPNLADPPLMAPAVAFSVYGTVDGRVRASSRMGLGADAATPILTFGEVSNITQAGSLHTEPSEVLIPWETASPLDSELVLSAQDIFSSVMQMAMLRESGVPVERLLDASLSPAGRLLGYRVTPDLLRPGGEGSEDTVNWDLLDDPRRLWFANVR